VEPLGRRTPGEDHNRDRRCSDSRYGKPDCCEARRPGPTRPLLPLNAGAQRIGRRDLLGRVAGQSERPLLLSEALSELRRCDDLLLEHRPALCRDRSIRKRGQLDELVRRGLIVSTVSHRQPPANGIPR
jgi:hypothetical protein